MKTTLTILSALFIAAIIALICTEAKINELEAQLSAIGDKRAHSEANKAETISTQAARIDTIRDTMYVTRVRTQIEWRDLISIAPPDSVVYVRLDSCIQVGAIVLEELALCDSASTLKDSALLAYSGAFASLDSALVREQGRSKRLKRQRNWAIGAALIALIVGVI